MVYEKSLLFRPFWGDPFAWRLILCSFWTVEFLVWLGRSSCFSHSGGFWSPGSKKRVGFWSVFEEWDNALTFSSLYFGDFLADPSSGQVSFWTNDFFLFVLRDVCWVNNSSLLPESTYSNLCKIVFLWNDQVPVELMTKFEKVLCGWRSGFCLFSPSFGSVDFWCCESTVVNQGKFAIIEIFCVWAACWHAFCLKLPSEV